MVPFCLFLCLSFRNMYVAMDDRMVTPRAPRRRARVSLSMATPPSNLISNRTPFSTFGDSGGAREGRRGRASLSMATSPLAISGAVTTVATGSEQRLDGNPWLGGRAESPSTVSVCTWSDVLFATCVRVHEWKTPCYSLPLMHVSVVLYFSDGVLPSCLFPALHTLLIAAANSTAGEENSSHQTDLDVSLPSRAHQLPHPPSLAPAAMNRLSRGIRRYRPPAER